MTTEKDTTHAERLAFQQGYAAGVIEVLRMVRRRLLRVEDEPLPDDLGPRARGFVRHRLSAVRSYVEDRAFVDANRGEAAAWQQRQSRGEGPCWFEN